MSVASTGAGIKNIAIGAAVLVGVVGVLYLFFKGKQGLQAAGKAVSDAAGFVFSAGDAPETLGTKLFDLFNPEPRGSGDLPYWWDATQAEKTRIALIGARDKTGFE